MPHMERIDDDQPPQLAGDPPADSVPTRNPSRLVFVPPPPGPGMPRRRLNSPVSALVIGGVLAYFLIVVRGGTPLLWAAVMTPIVIGVAVVLVIAYCRADRSHAIERSSFLAKRPNWRDDPLATPLAGIWKEPDRVPKSADVRAAVGDLAALDGDERPMIVCFGEADVPDVGDYHFEPEIITPTESIWREMVWPMVAGVFVVFCAVSYLGWLPSWIPRAGAFIGGMAWFLAAGVFVLATWAWKAMLRPTYYRMAPGVIQVLVYGPFRTKPAVRCYPAAAGTLAVFTRIRKKLVLNLSRGDHEDVLYVSRMRDRTRVLQRAWQALLSTAPTPPMSDDALLG